MEQAPWAVYAARNTHRDTIGRDEFLQLRLPLVGLMDANEIEEILDTVRSSGDVVLDGLQVVDDLSIASLTAGRETDVPTSAAATAINSVPASPTLQRRPRTSRSAARSSALELPFLGEEEDGEEEDEGEDGVKTAHRSSWRRGFKAVFRRGRGRI